MAKRRVKKSVSPVAALLANPPHRQKRCLTCQADGKFHQYIEEFIAGKNEGSRVSWQAFYDLVMVPEGYRYSIAAMRSHVQVCLGVKW